LDKLLTYPGYDPQGGPHLFSLETTPVEHIKLATALHPDIAAHIRQAKPIPGKTQMLIDALGCSEFWGNNVNGDRFPSAALAHVGPDYGARTFEVYAFPFKHHVNKDPARAYGDKVTIARFYAPTGRVQLIVSFDNTKAADIVQNVENGVYPDVSMGCRVPFDVCTVCGNKAKTRADYCPHLRYQMNKILPDGRIVGAVNTMPKFFDISVVLIGAEKASHILKKVASVSRPYEVSSALAAELHYGKLAAAAKAAADKEADIDKQVPSNLPASDRVHPSEALAELEDGMTEAKSHEPTLPRTVLDQMAQSPLQEIFSTLAVLGIPLKPHEFQRILLVKMGKVAAANQLWADGAVFDEYARTSPPPAGTFVFSHAAVSEKLAFELLPYMRERSCHLPLLERRLNDFEKRAEDWFHEKERTKSPTYMSMIPVMLGLTAAYQLFKSKLPGVPKGGFEKTIGAHPWVLPLLFGLGVGATVGLKGLMTPIKLQSSGPVDTYPGDKYAAVKTAISPAWLQLGAVPAMYMYSGVQRHRAARGEQLGSIDRFIAQRPDISSLAAFFAVPQARKGYAGALKMIKGASVVADMGIYAIGSGAKLMPAALAGAALDIGVLRAIQNIVQRRLGHHGHQSQ